MKEDDPRDHRRAKRSREPAHRRMWAQRLWGSPALSPAAAVAHLGAVQAQELPLAYWSVGQRCNAPSRSNVEAALAAGEILRTHVLRPTWHFVVPEDIRWMLELTGPRIAARMRPYDRQLELDEKLYARANRVIAKAVDKGTHLTRKDLGDALERAKIPARGQRLNHIAMRAELELIICSGRPQGRVQTYTSVDARTTKPKSFDRDDAVAELAHRYFVSHGPATIKDFVWWSGLTQADAKAALPVAPLESETVDGRTYFFDAAHASATLNANTIDLVQIYDEIGIAYSESRDVLLGSIKLPSMVEQGGLLHTLLLDGHFAGRWRTSSKSGWSEVDLIIKHKLSTEQRSALAEAVDRYRRFQGS